MILNQYYAESFSESQSTVKRCDILQGLISLPLPDALDLPMVEETEDSPLLMPLPAAIFSSVEEADTHSLFLQFKHMLLLRSGIATPTGL
jgi:hypothetical protein